MSTNPALSATPDDRAKFIAWLKQQTYCMDVYKTAALDGFATNPKDSVSLQNLFAHYQAGDTAFPQNWLISESGHSLDRPDWTSWGDTSIGPEIKWLQNLVLDMRQRLAQYIAIGGNNTALIDTIRTEITSYESTLAGYMAQNAKDVQHSKKPGSK